MAVNSITFNGRNSLDYGLYVSGGKTFNSAEKDYSKVSVPGRSGDLLIFNNRFKNVNVVYDSIIIENYYENVELIREWLLTADGYCRLEDTYHPDEFRIASFSGPIEIDNMYFQAGSTSLTFDAKPQRWLKSGENKILVTPEYNYPIVNPTACTSQPLIRVYLSETATSGHVLVGAGEITVEKPDTFTGDFWVDIDCSIMDCYRETTNMNPHVKISKWPEFKAGNSYVVFDDNTDITKIEIIPRWWRL